MISNAKVGDKVWSFAYGWGIIVEIRHEFIYPIIVRFLKTSSTFTLDGKEMTNDLRPTLLWDEVKYEVPKRPLPELKVDTKVIVWNDNEGKYRRHFHSFTEDGKIRTWADSTSSFTALGSENYTIWSNWKLFEEDKQ